MCLDLSGQQPGAGLRSRASTLLLIALRRSIGEHSGRCKLKFVCAHVFTSVSIQNLLYPRSIDMQTKREIWLLTLGTTIVEVPVAFAVFAVFSH